MFNLLITLIGIALVATLTLTGVYYGGDSMVTARDRAVARAIISDGQRISVAWKEWSRDKGNTVSLVDFDWSDGTAADLVPNYMLQLPQPAQSDVLNYSIRFIPVKADNVDLTIAGATAVSDDPDVDSLLLVMNRQSLCEKVAAEARGASANPQLIGAAETDFRQFVTSNKKFDCLYKDSDASGNLSAGDTFYFIMMVH
jgi:hypothetical protein